MKKSLKNNILDKQLKQANNIKYADITEYVLEIAYQVCDKKSFPL